MKKIISIIVLSLIIGVFGYLPLQVNKVSAASTPTDDVYYQGIFLQDNKYQSFTGVSQIYYKNTNSLDTVTTGNGRSINLNDSEVCSNMSSTKVKCTSDNKIIGLLAWIKIDRNGEVTMGTENSVVINNLRFYYIIANKSNSAQLYCDDSNGDNQLDLCDGAKNIYDTGDIVSNWKNLARSGGNLVYSSSSIEEVFTINEKSGGAKSYTDYNIFDNMNTTYLKLAESAGVYVFCDFTINYNNRVYYSNREMTQTSSQLFTFGAIGNDSGRTESSQLIVCDKATDENGCTSNVTTVSKRAALIRPQSSTTVEGNSGYNRLHNYFVDTALPIIFILVGVMLLVGGISNGFTIVKSSDEPEIRRAAIKRFIGLFIGALAIFVITIFYQELIQIVYDWLQ